MTSRFRKFFALVTCLNLFVLSARAMANEVVLDLPVGCRLGESCFIQHYPDMDPSKNAKDHTCGYLTYDGHKGTDFRLRTLADMEAGVPVLAAADGVVSNLRDGVKDQYFEDYPAAVRPRIKNIGLGNAVVLTHDDGLKTIYAHMKKNSIAVTKSQKVKRGDIIGYVGLSGLTEFPHLHFQVMSGKAVIDPFSGPQKTTPCTHTETSLWSEAARQELEYQATGFLVTGFSGTIPKDRRALESGNMQQRLLPPNSPTLIFWSLYYGSQKDDVVTLTIEGPDNQLIKEYKPKRVSKNQISKYFFVGIKQPKSGWQKGDYRGQITIERSSTTIVEEAKITVR
ncbi:M23 family metallopeptidase [Sneathiella marina]|uniref:M23 family metallopeptidase n=1 Tax=Sneathiella marina TaxID=2950108 RepID=A0ABY4W3J8_9PROT|nr:M23 family metallopeptidase [Sneathiella marina]USG61537.1 M23 family metallopeptidase [Sneathiella marina]